MYATTLTNGSIATINSYCHKYRSGGYCEKRVRADGWGGSGRVNCRFGYPFQRCESPLLKFDELRNGKVQEKIVTKRNAGTINSHCSLMLSHWQANIDFQLIFDWEQALRYMVKYISNAEKRT